MVVVGNDIIVVNGTWLKLCNMDVEMLSWTLLCGVDHKSLLPDALTALSLVSVSRVPAYPGYCRPAVL